MVTRDIADFSSIGHRLRNVRAWHGQAIDLPGITAEQFAGLLGTRPSTYAAYERDERDPPASFLASLRGKTSVDLNWLCCGDD